MLIASNSEKVGGARALDMILYNSTSFKQKKRRLIKVDASMKL